MKGLQYAIDLVDRTFGVNIRKAKSSTKGLDEAVGKADRTIAKIGLTGKRSFGNIGRYARKAALIVGTAFAVTRVAAFGNELTHLEARFQGMENAITFASGKEGAANIDFLNNKIDTLNLAMEPSYKGFQTLSGAMRGTKLEGQGVRNIFESVAIASTTMGLSAEQSEGAFLALSQMASKGKVQAEELRGQLGERIPGALKIAADAMGVNQVQFNKMLDTGKIYANDFLPKFAKQLKKEFSGGLEKAANSMQALINKQQNAVIRFKRATAGFFTPVIVSVLTGLTKLAQWAKDFLPKLEPVNTAVKNLFLAFSPVVEVLQQLSNKMGGAEGAVNALTKAINYITPIVGWLAEGLAGAIEIVAMAPELFAALAIAVWAVNVAMYANPVGLVVAAVVALIAVIGHAYRKVGWFRGGLMAAWETVKGFGMALHLAIITRFKQLLSGLSGIAKSVKQLFQGEWKKAFKTAKEARNDLFSSKAGNAFIDNMKRVGNKAGEKYRQGVEEAAANKKKGGFLEGLAKGVAPTHAQAKFLGNGGGLATNTTGGTPKGTGGAGSSLPSSGTTQKHTTFNIQSLVQELTIQTTNLTGDPVDVKRQLEQLFLELLGDIELRANG